MKQKKEFVDRFVDPEERVSFNKKKLAKVLGWMLLFSFFLGFAIGYWVF